MNDKEDNLTMFDVAYARKTERAVLQQLIMVARLSCDAEDGTELGDCWEKFSVQLKKQNMWDKEITGLLMIYPSFLLSVIETSEHMLDCFLKNLPAMQQQPNCSWPEAKVVFMCHNLESRQFQQWSYKVVNAELLPGNPVVRRLEELDESIENLVCSVLTLLQELVKHLETPQEVLPGSVLDENPELLIPPVILQKLLGREELLSPQQYLQMYHSTLNICIEFGLASPNFEHCKMRKRVTVKIPAAMAACTTV